MILAMHQPYFLPWAGWFAKFRAADVFVIMDTAQVPVSRRCYSRQVKIKGRWLKIEIDQKGLPHNRTKILPASKAKACELLGEVYKDTRHATLLWYIQNCLHNQQENLARYNVGIIKKLCREFGLDWSKVVYLSETGIEAPRERLASQLALEFGCDVYLSGVGAASYNVPERFGRLGIELRYIKHNCSPFSVAHNILQGGGLGMKKSRFLDSAVLHEDCSH